MTKENSWTDHYTNRAKREKWLARSVYKLEEIDRKYNLIRPEDRVLDLGCYPGSWSQYSLKKVGERGNVLGLDISEPKGLSARNFRFIKADILTIETSLLAEATGETDTVISDLAPQTTGIKSADTYRSIVLAEKAFEISLAVLKNNGNFICKVFEGEDFKGFKERTSGSFASVKLFRPLAVRKRSKEIYLIGLKFIKKTIDSVVN